MTIMAIYTHKALSLEVDGNIDEMSVAGVTRQVSFIKQRLVLAKQDAASPRGKTLRETGLIRIPLGTTGRILSFGEINPEADEIQRASLWRTTIKEALDALSLIVRFGYFITDVESVMKLKDGVQWHAKEKMVAQVKASGGLSWEKDRLHPAKSVGKVFRDWKAYVQEFHSWEAEVRAAEAELHRVESLPTVEEVTAELAATIGGEIGNPAVEPKAESQQEAMLEAVGAVEVVLENAPAKPAPVLTGMSQEELAALIAAAQQMQQAQGASNPA